MFGKRLFVVIQLTVRGVTSRNEKKNPRVGTGSQSKMSFPVLGEVLDYCI